MCIPVAAALAVAGGVTQAMGALSAGQSAAAQSKYEAQVSRMNERMEVDAAHQSVLAGNDERRDFWRKVSAVKGQNIASMAANGIDVGYGSAARLQEDTQMLAEDDAKNLYRNIEERTKGHYISAANYEADGKAKIARAKAAKTASYFSAASSLIGSFGQAASMMPKISH